MRIVFDMDNTLVDEVGATVRPGIVDLLERLRGENHGLILWTSSTQARAESILREHRLRAHFSHALFREQYDPQNTGAPKDIRTVKGDWLVDDDPKQVAFVRSIGKRGFQISAYRRNSALNPGELERLYGEIKGGKGWLGKILG